MKKNIREILEKLARHSYQAKGTDSYYPIVNQAEKEIERTISHLQDKDESGLLEVCRYLVKNGWNADVSERAKQAISNYENQSATKDKGITVEEEKEMDIVSLMKLEKTKEKSDFMNDLMEHNATGEYLKIIINGRKVNSGIRCKETGEYMPFSYRIDRLPQVVRKEEMDEKKLSKFIKDNVELIWMQSPKDNCAVIKLNKNNIECLNDLAHAIVSNFSPHKISKAELERVWPKKKVCKGCDHTYTIDELKDKVSCCPDGNYGEHTYNQALTDCFKVVSEYLESKGVITKGGGE